MKTAEQLKEIIAQNRVVIEKHFNEVPKKELKKRIKQNTLLVPIYQYLESKPTEQYLVSEKKRTKRIILAKQEQYGQWESINKEPMSPTKKIRLFNKETGLTGLRKQLKTLNFILNDKQESTTLR